ncbi:MAG TPA: flagellar brake domain-containing protein [Bacillales bacterium]|nr:flagellar brake domain-containing protein [Bacillales bacterium]
MKIGATLYLQQGDEQYRSRIVEMNDLQFFIDLPVDIVTHRTREMSEGTSFQVSFIDDDSGIYKFSSNIVGRKLGRVPMLIIERPDVSKLVRTQRREYLRIDSEVDVAVHPKVERFHAFTTTSVDLGGGGMAIKLPKHHGLKENMEIYCWLVLTKQSGDSDYLFLTCKVLRIFKPEYGLNEFASIGFVSVKEKEQQMIIRYCFEKQLDLKKKGLAN